MESSALSAYGVQSYHLFTMHFSMPHWPSVLQGWEKYFPIFVVHMENFSGGTYRSQLADSINSYICFDLGVSCCRSSDFYVVLFSEALLVHDGRKWTTDLPIHLAHCFTKIFSVFTIICTNYLGTPVPPSWLFLKISSSPEI